MGINLATIYEPCYEKTGFLHMRKKKTQISCAVTAKLISAVVFATWIVQSLYYLDPKFQAVAVQPGLCGTWSETPKTSFLTVRLIFKTMLLSGFVSK